MALDTGGLRRFIERNAEANRVDITRIARFDGGAVAENYALDLRIADGAYAGRQRWVLRADPPARLAASHRRADEFAILKFVFAAGLLVPEPLWCCTDSTVVGQEFFIMRRVGGVADPSATVGESVDATTRRRILTTLGTQLGYLHRLQPTDSMQAALRRPSRPIAGVRIGEYRSRLDRLARTQPVLEYALRWLETHAPAELPMVLGHGDFRTGNFLVDEAQVSAILDWEFSSFADPDEDIAWFCCRAWRFGAFDQEAGGIGSRTDFYDAYEFASRRNIARKRVEYWEIMGAVKWALLALEQADRHLSGREPSLALALTGRMVAEIEMDILKQMESLANVDQ